MNLREIDVCEPKSRLRKISRWILAAEGDYIKEREREREDISCPSSYATIDFATWGISLANVAYVPRRRMGGEVSTSRNPRYERTREDTQTPNKIGARCIQRRDESRLVDATRTHGTRVKRSASRCVRPPFRKDTERFSTTYGSGA